MRKIWKRSVLVLLVILVPLSLFVFFPSPWQLQGEHSSQWQSSSRYEIKKEAISLVDKSRTTPANGSFKGDPSRTLDGYVWYPLLEAGKRANFPLLVYSHGFMSFSEEAEYLNRFLARNGYVVIAVDYPLSNMLAPGGAVIMDVAKQAGDVSFLIDQALDQNVFPAFAANIDPDRIAIAGLSLGGLTTTLAAFHPELRDNRVDAAVSIAGPSEMFTKDFFANASGLPFMMIAGDIDALVPYPENGRAVLHKSPGSTLVTLKGGSHTGFAGPGGKALRFLDNPDLVGCTVVRNNIDLETNPFEGVFNEADGVVIDVDNTRLPCETWPLPAAMNPRQQHALNTLAVYAFLESLFAETEAERKTAEAFLYRHFPTENSALLVEKSGLGLSNAEESVMFDRNAVE